MNNFNPNMPIDELNQKILDMSDHEFITCHHIAQAIINGMIEQLDAAGVMVLDGSTPKTTCTGFLVSEILRGAFEMTVSDEKVRERVKNHLEMTKAQNQAAKAREQNNAN